MQLYWNHTLIWTLLRKFTPYPKNTPKTKHHWGSCFRYIYNTLIANILNLHLLWLKPGTVFKQTIVYWPKSSSRWVSFYRKKLATVRSFISFSLVWTAKNYQFLFRFLRGNCSKELVLFRNFSASFSEFSWYWKVY